MPRYDTYGSSRADLGVPFREFDPNLIEAIAPQILPVVPVTKQAATMSVITRESTLKRVDVKRAANGAYNRIEIEGKDKSYACEEYALEGRVDDRKRAFYQNDFDLEAETRDAIRAKLEMEWDIRVATAVFNTTTWPSGTAALFTDNSGSPWSTVATGIIGQVIAAKEKHRENTGIMPNALIIGAGSLQYC